MSPEFVSNAAASVAQRAVLLLNHVLSGEPQAMQRLVVHAGRTVSLQVQSTVPLLAALAPLVMRVTPAGLLEWIEAPGPVECDLRLRVDATDPKAIVKQAITGQRPRIDVAGDASLAADVNWLFDNLRWEPFEDLSRWWGDPAAAELSRMAHSASQAARRAGEELVATVSRFLAADAAERKPH